MFCESTSDLFEFAQISFEYDYNAFINDMRHRYMMNVFQSISSNEEYIDNFNQIRREYIMSILNKMDLSELRFTKEDDLIKMYQMIQILKRRIIQKAIVEKFTKEEAAADFSWYLDIMKRGLIGEK